MTQVEIERFAGDAHAMAAVLLSICETIFPGLDPAYLTDRLPHVADPHLLVARREGEAIGFKLGYRRGPQLLYSWLGGVMPEARRSGVAAMLMERQHADAAAAGYRLVETRTRAANSAMIILNLRHGFVVTGFEIDAKGIAVVTQRKVIAPPGEV